MISVRSEVQILPGPPSFAPSGRFGWHAIPASTGPALRSFSVGGGIAQLGERLLCKQEVVGSIPSASTIDIELRAASRRRSFFDIVHRKRSESLNFRALSPRQSGRKGKRGRSCGGGRPLHGTSRNGDRKIAISLTNVRSSTTRAFGGCLGTERR